MDPRKYGRTYHFPFSPGTTSDDRINHHYQRDLDKIKTLIITEKLDGENNCINKYGVFARSHATPSVQPWTQYLRTKWETIKHELGTLEIFGENLFAQHSIGYNNLPSHFYVFAVRDGDTWLDWDVVDFYARCYDFPTVPVLGWCGVKPGWEYLSDEPEYRVDELDTLVPKLTSTQSVFGSYDVHTGLPCTREGIVVRNYNEFPVSSFQHNVFKYVRKNHVKTDEHWIRNWKRAPLINENKYYAQSNQDQNDQQ